MSIIKKPYEISVWEDKIQYVGTDGNVYNSIFEMSVPVDYQYYTESRLATIGSNTMDSPARATNAILTRNINGTETLKFDMYYQYIDNESGDLIHNPLIDLLVNERKIKLYYNDDDPNHPDHWYDFIIKKDEEKARDNKYSFTCTSLAANELGKTGFKIELDTELENNMGTVQELGEKVLEGSDWQLAAQGQTTLQQTINEPLYKILTNTSFIANLRVPKDEGQNNIIYTKEIPSGKYIYVYYTPYAQKETDYFQFIYIEDNATITTLTDGITLVCDDENVWDLYLTNVEWVDDKPSFEYIGYYQTVVSETAFNNNPTNYYIYDQETQEYIQCTYESTYSLEETYYIKGDVSMAQYRGDRYVRKQKTTYDSTLKKTVKIYTDNSDPARTVYGYQTTRYYDVNSIYNYIHNSTNFGSTSYWSGYGNGTVSTVVDKVIYPPVNPENVEEERKNYLSVFIGNDWTDENNVLQRARIMNNGIVYNYAKINTFDKGEKYIFRVKVKGYDKDNDILSEYLNNSTNFPFTCQVRKYVKIDKYTDDDYRYFNFLGSNAQPDYDLVKDLTQEEFDNNKENYYIYNNGSFDQCQNESVFSEDTNYFTPNGYAIITASCDRGASWNDLKENLGIFLFRSLIYDTNYDSYFIEDIQLYKAIPREEGGYYKIGDVPEVKFETVDHYYYPDENGSFTNPDDYTYITDTYYKANIDENEFNANKTKYWYVENEEWVQCDENSIYNSEIQYYTLLILTPVYGSGEQEFEKVRSLSKKESNRFNLLQELCETFECWVKFNIAHELNGQISIENYIYYNPIKWNSLSQNDFEQGAINSSDGQNYSIISNTRIRTIGYIKVNPNTNYKVNTNIAKCFIFEYENDKSYYRGSGWKNKGYNFTTSPTTYYIRVTLAKNSSSGITEEIHPNDLKYCDFNLNEPEYYFYNNLTHEFELASEYQENQQYYEALTRKRQDKKVIFYGEILEDNPVGFKYGINLKNVTRTLDSDEIATKIIVKNNSCEQAENGFCSIARAKDNPTKENFLYNFDYYVKQGILDQSILYNDLYLKLNGSIGLYPKLAEYNSQRNQLISDSTELANSIMQLTSKTQEALLEYNSAKEELFKLVDPVSGKLYKYTNYVYEDFCNQIGRNVSWMPAYKQIYYLKVGNNMDSEQQQPTAGLTNIKEKNNNENDNAAINIRYFYKKFDIDLLPRIIGENISSTYPYQDDVENGHFKKNWYSLKYYYLEGTYYRRCREQEEIVNDRTYIYFGEKDKTPFYIENLTDGFLHYEDKYTLPNDGRTYYWSYDLVSEEDKIKTNGYFNNDLYFQVHKDLISFTYTDVPEVYIYGAYKRIKQASNDDLVNDTKTVDYITQIQTLEKTVQSSETEYDLQNQNLKQAQESYDEIVKQLNDIAFVTEEIEKEFVTKYARYIQEGSWNDDNYMDDDLYYLDAVNVLYQSAYPKTSYTIDVLELSALEGYEAYKFQLAHKTFIEDTEFFGWIDYANKIPARENVVVTELTTTFDEPDKNTIKVQNYKSHFEDLFQRITAVTQNLEYHSGDYKRASDAIQSNGTLQQSVLQNTLTTAAYILSNANNQSVVINNTGLQATKTDKPGEVVLLTSGGILISSDGENWGVAISADGINTERLSAGTINTENITIMNGNYPTFKWDTNGLRAFAFTQNNGNISSYNANNYVTFDRFGIYGINGITAFAPNTVTDVEKQANFALTWNGLFIRSNYRQGYVSISPNDDITLYSYGQQRFNSIGSINTINDIYYFNNRSAFYYKYNQNDDNYIQCTTENYSDLAEKNIYVVGFERLQNTPEELTSNYYYLLGGEFIQCVGNEPSDLTNNIFYQKDNSSNNGNTAIKRAKFGMIGSNEEELFGIALYSQNGDITVTTQSDGRLWLQDSIKIGKTGQTNTIYMGVGENEYIDGISTGRYKVINVNDLNNNEKFVVYSDGTLKAFGVNIEGVIHAESGEFTGTIHANNGDIGGNIIDSSGITIVNAGFRIQDNDNRNVLEFDKVNNILKIEGNIETYGGNIGGFTIGQNSIISDGLELWSKNDDNPSKIIVDNIDIGTGANITDYLEIGNLRLLNPNKNNDQVLTLNNDENNYFTLFNNGDIQGNNWSIKKDDYYSYIKISNEEPPSDFNINYSEYYYYNEENNNYIQCTSSDNDKAPYYIKKKLVTAKFDRGEFTGTIKATDGEFRGAITAATINATTINTINFVTEKIRSMGGAFIFKPTFECDFIEKNGQDIIVKLNNKDNNGDFTQFSLYDIVGFTDSNTDNGVIVGQVTSTNSTDNKITVTTSANIYNDFKPTTITWFGKTSEDIIIGINSDINMSGNLLQPKSLTINSFSYDSGKLDPTVKLLLGDLTGAPIKDIEGYGLYADNVYLHGSLVTEITTEGADSYAGVNTIPTTTSSNFPGEKIVFWAGAENYNRADKSPFYVTEKGSIYASKGIFTGSVIAESVISNSTIEAAVIKGNKTSPSLKIYSTSENRGGMSFYKREIDISKEEIEQGTISSTTHENDNSNRSYRLRTKDYIQVYSNTSYYIYTNIPYFYIHSFDENKNYIEASGWKTSGYKFITSSTTKYVRIVFAKKTSIPYTSEDNINVNDYEYCYDDLLTLNITNNSISHNYQNNLIPIISFSDDSQDIYIYASNFQSVNTNYKDGKIQYNNSDIIKFNGNIEFNKNNNQYIKIIEDNIELKHQTIINDGEVIFSNTITDNNNVSTTYKLDYKINNGYYCLYVS